MTDISGGLSGSKWTTSIIDSLKIHSINLNDHDYHIEWWIIVIKILSKTNHKISYDIYKKLINESLIELINNTLVVLYNMKHKFKSDNRYRLINIILTLLNRLPIDIHLLKSSGIGKITNK